MMKSRKNLYIATFGCQMNEYDSQQISRILAPHGYVPVDRQDSADLIIINTCSIREKAEQKLYSHLGRLKKIKARNPNLIIGVGGCVAQQTGENLLARFEYLDLVFGTHTISQIPRMVEHIEKTGASVCNTEFTYCFDYPAEFGSNGHKPVKSLLTIMRGCNNYCTYCIVPYVRGREISRPRDDILEEARALVAAGVKEITLLGQNVNSYNPETTDGFVSLLHDFDKIEGLERIRFTTSHPKDLSPRLISSYGEMKKLCAHVHLPVQSGSNKVLKRMNRSYSREDYIQLTENLRKVRADISITTDIIVGFPGEEEIDFQHTLDLMRTVRFESAFSFKYSDRPFAKAANFSPKVPEEEKSRRLSELQNLQDQISLERNKLLEGTTKEILVEGYAKKTPEKLTGRTEGNHVVNFIGPDRLIGHIVPVRLMECFVHSIRGVHQKS